MSGINTFNHGVHPREFKQLSGNSPIERMPFVEEYILPLGQHIGAPSIPIVSKGQRVRRGEKIADPGGFVSVALHAPVDGVVTYIGLTSNPSGHATPAIRIKADPFSSQTLMEREKTGLDELDVKSFISEVQQAGIVGLGGAAFPAHVKFSIPEGKNCRFLILNGCECEPFLTSDHRVMLEYPDRLLNGVEILNRFIGAEKVFIGIENNKQDAIAALRERIVQRGLDIAVH
ncbi:MAG: electron transporter RnfC, partial [Flavobacteriales bacterium]